MPKLVLLSEGMTGRTYELKVETTTVGRVDDNAFAIPDGSVSSHHAEILLRGSDVVVRDLNSTNGTFIAGEKVTTEAVLKPGSILRLGTIEMRLEGDQPPTSSKKQLDQTRVIPQGVKLDELEGSRTTTFESSKGFSKKSNKGQLIFIGVVVVIGLALVGLLIWVVLK